MANSNVNVVISAEDKASKALQGLGSKMDKLGDKARHLAKRFAQVSAAALGAGVIFAVKLAVKFEQTQVAFETMLGSVEKAQVLLKDLSTLAAKTPFEINQVRDAAKQLLAYGISEEKIIETTRMLGDVSSGLGQHTFPQLVLAFGQIKAKGKLAGQELLQLTNAGFNVAEAMGVSRSKLMELMQEGDGVSFEDIERAFKRATSEGGRFNQMMEKQSQTIAGRWSNIKDQMTIALEALGMKTLPFLSIAMDNLTNVVLPAMGDAFKTLFTKVREVGSVFEDKYLPTIKNVSKAVIDILLPSFKALWHTIETDLIPALRRFWFAVLKPIARVLGATLVVAVKATTDVLNVLLSILSPLLNWMSKNTEIVHALTIAFIAVKAAMMITGLINSVTTAFTLMQAKIVATTNAVLGSKAALLSLAVPSTGAFALVATAGVIAAIAIASKWKETSRVIATTKKNIDSARRSMMTALEQMRELASEGKTTLKHLAKTEEALLGKFDKNRSIFESDSGNGSVFTGGFAEGGFTGRGAENDVAGIVHRGEYVIPKQNVDQASGMPKMAQNMGNGDKISLNVNIGMFAGTPAERRRIARQILDDLQDLASRQGKTALELLS